MACATTFPARDECEAFIPIPFRAEQQSVLQWYQIVAPAVGTALAFVHAYFYGIALGTLGIALILGTICGLGTTVGFHRLFTHRAFQTSPTLRNALAVIGSMASFHSLFLWVANHRQHHQFSDHHGDPHSPHPIDSTFRGRWRAFFHAHIGAVLKVRLTNDHLSYIPDLVSDPQLCRIQRLYLLWVALGFAIPAAILYAVHGTAQAALGGVLWGGFVRIFVSGQLNYAVNSVCHIWGKRPFQSRDMSCNNLVVALATMGEGWHNNHHAFPTSARHGLNSRQPDFSWTVIKLLARYGLVWNVITPTQRQIEAKLRGVDEPELVDGTCTFVTFSADDPPKVTPRTPPRTSPVPHHVLPS